MASKLITIDPGSSTWASDMNKNLDSLNSDTGWLAATMYAPITGRLYYKVTASGIYLKGFIDPNNFSNAQPVKAATIAVDSISDFGNDDKVFILGQAGGNYAIGTLNSQGELWLISVSGAITNAVHFDGIVIN